MFRYHWIEEVQHAMLDELEWTREDRRLAPAERDRAVDDLIALVGAVDGILQAQARADTRYFVNIAAATFDDAQRAVIADVFLRAYRWQYIVSGVQDGHFIKLLSGMTTPEQMQRIGARSRRSGVNARRSPRVVAKAKAEAEARRLYGVAVFAGLAAVLLIAAALVANAVMNIQIVS